MPPRPRHGSGRRAKPAKMGRREWTTCFTVTAFGVIGLYKLVMTLGDDPDMVTVTGLATVIDGDTLKVGDQKIRLQGIDAPELDQVCLDKNQYTYPCGEVAKKALQKYLGWSMVECMGEEKDKYDRLIARCTREGWLNTPIDIANWLILNGHGIAAFDEMFISPAFDSSDFILSDYFDSEEIAVGKGRGIWAGLFDEPSIWRKDSADCMLCIYGLSCSEDPKPCFVNIKNNKKKKKKKSSGTQ